MKYQIAILLGLTNAVQLEHKHKHRHHNNKRYEALSQAREFDGDMLKVISAQDYEAEAPNSYSADEPLLKNEDHTVPRNTEPSESDSFAVDMLVNNRQRKVPQPAPVV
jgi:hypothetical protein